MAGETTTPNIGLQVPAFNQANWQVPTNYNWNLLDLIMGGFVAIPALSVENISIANIGTQIASVFVAETPDGVVPGNVYTLTYTPAVLLGFFWNGVYQRPGIDYVLSGSTITMTSPTHTNDTVAVIYFQQNGSAVVPGSTTAFAQVPSGAVNGANITFTLTVSPIANTLALYVNGVFQTPTVDYTLADATITFVLPPPLGAALYAQGIS